MSTLTQCGITCQDPIYESNRCFRKQYQVVVILYLLFVLRMMAWSCNYLQKVFICSCVNFRDEAWFLSLRFFGLLSPSLLLFPQRFGRYVLQPSSGDCRTRESTRNFELCALFNPRWSPVLVLLAITGSKC